MLSISFFNKLIVFYFAIVQTTSLFILTVTKGFYMQVTTSFDFPNCANSEPIGSLLTIEDQIKMAATDWMAEANKLPKGKMQDNRKAEISAFVNALYADVNEMLRLGHNFAKIASTINDKIIAFDKAEQKHQGNSAAFDRDAQKVNEANRALGSTLRQMSVDFTPFTKKSGNEPAEKSQKKDEVLPRHQIVNQVYDRIVKLEQNWVEKGKNISEERDEQFVYYQQVRLHVIDLTKTAQRMLEVGESAGSIDFVIYHHGCVMDRGLERVFHHDTLHERAKVKKSEQEETLETMKLITQGMLFAH